MTVQESLKAIHTYPITDNVLENISDSRGLTLSDSVDRTIDAYKLAYADVLVWISQAPNITEEGISVEILVTDRKEMRARANRIYEELEDPNFIPPAKSGVTVYSPNVEDI